MTRIWNKRKLNTPIKRKVLVAMSGGVDSSVAAKLLVDQGYEVAGVFLHFWKEEAQNYLPDTRPTERSLPARTTLSGRGREGGWGDFENKCCSRQALLDARRVAIRIGIPLYALNFAQVFKKQVVDNFLNEYKRGRTANPCVRCNKLVKLGYLIKQAKKLGFDYVASGHYVKVKSQKSKVKSFYKLYKAKDENKDQSYFLYTLNQKELKHLLFPLADYSKSEVRQLAKKFRLPVAEKQDSQEICFIPEKSHNEFLKRHLKLRPGPIKLSTPKPPRLYKGVRPAQPPFQRGARGVKLIGNNKIPLTPNPPGPLYQGGTLKGAIVGQHQGLPLYTIGQRKGIHIGGSGPYYAAKMDYKNNTLYVVNKEDDPLLYSRSLAVKNVNWLFGSSPEMPLDCQIVIRYRQRPVKCVVSKFPPFKGGRGGLNYKVIFAKPLRAIAPGQSAVFYRGQEVLGGGVIRPL